MSRAKRLPLTWLAAAVLLAAYAGIRLLILPSDPLVARGFGHDAAYLVIVARNLLAGKGFVLDALWLVWKNPPALPMPYHNAGPLFPLLQAGLGRFFDTPLVLSGFVLSALASAALMLAVSLLVRAYVASTAAAVGIGVLVALFPPVWANSWEAITDQTWLALFALFVVFLVRGRRPAMAVAAGLFLGLAWLTRSATVLAVPAVGLWLFLTFGLRRALWRGLLIALTAGAVTSPWLLHTARTWGSPLASDQSELTAIHAYYAAQVGEMPERLWHSPNRPASFASVAWEHPGTVLRRSFSGIPFILREALRAAADSSYLGAGVLLALGAVIGFRQRRLWRRPEALACALYALTFMAAVAAGGRHIEDRYLLALFMLFAAWMLVSLYQVLLGVRAGQRDPIGLGTLALGALFLIGVVPRAGYGNAARLRGDEPDKRAYADASVRLARGMSGGTPVVVGSYPYYYSLVTGAQALSIPYADDAFLQSYMKKYHARFVFLTAAERRFWRPDWEKALPSFLEIRDTTGGFLVYGATTP
ncbi:MAG: hypothetical protein ABSD56_00475 [Bryobacteraceae bacterium]